MSDARASLPTPTVWIRRVAVVSLFAVAGLLIMGPSVGVLKTFVMPPILMLVWRSYQRTIAETRAMRSGRPAATASKRAYAIYATAFAALLSLPLWILCNKLLIAITLVPALICVWFGTYLIREA